MTKCPIFFQKGKGVQICKYRKFKCNLITLMPNKWLSDDITYFQICLYSFLPSQTSMNYSVFILSSFFSKNKNKYWQPLWFSKSDWISTWRNRSVLINNENYVMSQNCDQKGNTFQFSSFTTFKLHFYFFSLVYWIYD